MNSFLLLEELPLSVEQDPILTIVVVVVVVTNKETSITFFFTNILMYSMKTPFLHMIHNHYPKLTI